MATATELASCRGVSVVHGSGSTGVTALARVDFEVRERERVALFGPSGSGKTTLLHVLGGLIAPAQGEVRWRGASLSTLDASARGRERARGIAFVFQGSNLLPTFTAYENVAFAAHASRGNDGWDRTAPDPGELLALVGLEASSMRYQPNFPAASPSGSRSRARWRQRPALLLCDEPTGHLDSDTGARVLDLIEAVQVEFAFALVAATHDADVAARAERTVVLADGRVSGDGQSS